MHCHFETKSCFGHYVGVLLYLFFMLLIPHLDSDIMPLPSLCASVTICPSFIHQKVVAFLFNREVKQTSQTLNKMILQKNQTLEATVEIIFSGGGIYVCRAIA